MDCLSSVFSSLKYIADIVADAADLLWYPREKVNFAHRKLHGDNAAHIMRYFHTSRSLQGEFLSVLCNANA